MVHALTAPCVDLRSGRSERPTARPPRPLAKKGTMRPRAALGVRAATANGAAGGVSAAVLSTLLYKNLDITMFMNGVLGGLVGITAGADQMGPTEAIMIGSIGGIIVVLGVALLDKCKLDDPVGAIPVHLFAGIWGTLAVGIFGSSASFEQFMIQLASVGIVGLFCVICTFLITIIVKLFIGLRVSEEEEEKGLDITEHGTKAYFSS